MKGHSVFFIAKSVLETAMPEQPALSTAPSLSNVSVGPKGAESGSDHQTYKFFGFHDSAGRLSSGCSYISNDVLLVGSGLSRIHKRPNASLDL